MASEYLKWKYRDVKPDQPREYTRSEKRRNWWYYNKWYVVIGIIVLIIAADIAKNALHIGQSMPDYQIAYVGSSRLPEDTARAIEEAFAALGEDLNGDGTVYVKLNQYADETASGSEDAANYAVAASVLLMADLEDCDSYFFLLEDPAGFQKNYAALRSLDGSLSENGSTDVGELCIAWEDCPGFASLDLGEYSESSLGTVMSGDSNERVSGLYIARRGFWTDKTCKYPDGCDSLWEKIMEGAEK